MFIYISNGTTPAYLFVIKGSERSRQTGGP